MANTAVGTKLGTEACSVNSPDNGIGCRRCIVTRLTASHLGRPGLPARRAYEDWIRDARMARAKSRLGQTAITRQPYLRFVRFTRVRRCR